MEIKAPTEALRLFAFHLMNEMFPDGIADGVLTLHSKREGDAFFATAQLGTHAFSASADLGTHFTEKRTENVACGKALFALFRALSGASVPYGTLVGVRPVKIAVFYLAHGLDAKQTRARLVRDYCMSEEKAALLCSLAELEFEAECALHKNDAMLYLSIPFCPSRCRYCSFVSHSAPSQLALLDEYLDRMKEELQETGELFRETGRKLRAVYLGGGTPGLLSAKQLDGLFTLLKQEFSLPPDTEVTAELGRPDTITDEKCRVLSDHKISRVCINPQSLNDEVLSVNRRAHTAADFYRAYECAERAEIPTINTDLIAGLVGDTPEGFLKTVDEIHALSPENLTIHALCKKRASSEEASPDPDEDHRWLDAMQTAERACIKKGYAPYYLYRQKNTIANLENLGYTKEDHACFYNIAMMEDLCDIFAVGAGAMTKLRRKTDDGYQMIRLPAYKYPSEYLADPEKGRRNRTEAKTLCLE